MNAKEKVLIITCFFCVCRLSAQKAIHLSFGIEMGHIATRDHKYISSALLLGDEYFYYQYHPVTNSYGEKEGTKVSTKLSPGINIHLSFTKTLSQTFSFRYTRLTYISENKHTSPEGYAKIKVSDIFDRFQLLYSIGYGRNFYGKLGLAFSLNKYSHSVLKKEIYGTQLGVEPPDNIISPPGNSAECCPQVKNYNETSSEQRKIESRNNLSISASLVPEIGYNFKQFQIYYCLDWSTFIVPSDADIYWFGFDYTYRYQGHFLGIRYRFLFPVRSKQ